MQIRSKAGREKRGRGARGKHFFIRLKEKLGSLPPKISRCALRVDREGTGRNRTQKNNCSEREKKRENPSLKERNDSKRQKIGTGRITPQYVKRVRNSEKGKRKRPNERGGGAAPARYVDINAYLNLGRPE